MNMRMRAMALAAPVFLFLQSSPVLAQTLGQGDDDGISIWRIVAALLFCMILAVAGAFALKAGLGRGQISFFTTKKSRRLELVESLRLSHQIDLCIVTCDGRELLVSASAHGAELLDHLPIADKQT